MPCGCALLVGAGCSVSAGIPTAQGFIDRIKTEYFDKWEDGDSPDDYSGCMTALGEYRRHFIQEIVEESKVLNPAHVAIGQLLKERFVDRILTTNFDPLIVRACAFVREEPAVYDLPTLAHREFKPDRIALPAVFYLHGQHSGVIHLNTDADFERYGEAVWPVIESTNDDCTWIVVGYSGENDPTISQFEKLEKFEQRLYWVTWNDEKPCARVTKMLESSKNAYLVRGYDADRFFVSLARELDCFPPQLLLEPFTHLSKLVDLVRVPTDWREAKEGLLQETARQLAKATARIRKIKRLVEGPWTELAGEESLDPPEVKPGLIASLSLFSGRGGYLSAEAMAGSFEQPDFRGRALQTNWGPLLAAVEYHAAQLRHCWLVCTQQVAGDYQHAASLIAKSAPGAECHAVFVDDQNSIFLVQRAINEVYDTLAREHRLGPNDIVADITSGLSSMTGGMVLATLDADRAIQYLRQGEALVKGGVAVTRDEIRERRLLIGIRTSSSFVRDAVVREAMA